MQKIRQEDYFQILFQLEKTADLMVNSSVRRARFDSLSIPQIFKKIYCKKCLYCKNVLFDK